MGFCKTPGRSGSGPFTGSPRVDPKAKNFYSKLRWRDLQQKQTCEHSLFDFQLNSPEGFSFHEQIVRTLWNIKSFSSEKRYKNLLLWGSKEKFEQDEENSLGSEKRQIIKVIESVINQMVLPEDLSCGCCCAIEKFLF
ncbi:hypothetical protein RUM43_004939 [Polyplax serrata]|uniref:Uncharacterized protein n=1 Tax=Polyplax serrata TaxID=468196 RepID=A0AAN8XM96_POLSC